jgi:Lrp/AsnC family transcriptional regulator
MKLDELDKKLLQLLQADSKANANRLAAALGLTKTPVYDRIRKLEEAGLIKKYVAVLEQSMLPSYMVVFYSMFLESQKLEAIESLSRTFSDFPEVKECYLMGGASDFLLNLIMKGLNGYHQFSSEKLAALPNISQIQSSFVLQ